MTNKSFLSGIIPPRSVLILGPDHLTTRFSIALCDCYLMKGSEIVFITTKHRSKFKKRKEDGVNKITFLELLPSGSVNLSATQEISKVIANRINQTSKRNLIIIFHSLTEIFNYCDTSAIFKFFNQQCGKNSDDWNAIFFITLVKESHKVREVERLKSMADSTMEIIQQNNRIILKIIRIPERFFDFTQYVLEFRESGFKAEPLKEELEVPDVPSIKEQIDGMLREDSGVLGVDLKEKMVEKIRGDILQIDEKFLEALLDWYGGRINKVEEIVKYKVALGLPIYDEKRESEVLEKWKEILDSSSTRYGIEIPEILVSRILELIVQTMVTSVAREGIKADPQIPYYFTLDVLLTIMKAEDQKISKQKIAEIAKKYNQEDADEILGRLIKVRILRQDDEGNYLR